MMNPSAFLDDLNDLYDGLPMQGLGNVNLDPVDPSIFQPLQSATQASNVQLLENTPLNSSLRLGLEAVEGISRFYNQPPAAGSLREPKRKRVDDAEDRAPASGQAPAPLLVTRGRQLFAQWAANCDAATGGRLLREFDTELNGHALTHFFKIDFRKKESGEANPHLLLLMARARDAFNARYSQPPKSDIPINDALASFSAERFDYWKFFAIVEVMKVCYPNEAEPLRPSFNLIPGFPPPWGALHNIDTVENLKVLGILFTNTDQGVMTPTYEAAILCLAGASVPITHASSWNIAGFRYGTLDRRVTIFFCATAGAILCFCVLCHKGGIYQPSNMDVELYYPLYCKILKTLEGLIRNNPGYLQRLGVLFMASRAGVELLPTKNVFESLEI